MAFVIADRVRESSTTTGTGNFTLGGAITGYQTFDAVLDSGDTTYYTIADQGGSNWEVGIGTFTSPSTLARTTILSSSNGGSVVTFTAGTKDVFISLPASKTNTNDQPNVISVNSTSDALRITQTGTGNALVVEDSANPDATPFVVNSDGVVGIGSTSLAGYAMRITRPLTGAVTARSVLSQPTFQSDVTTAGYSYESIATTAAASFTLGTLTHYLANQGTFGAGSTVTNQYGFRATSGLTGATANYGFHSEIASGAGRWNFYSAGTADNYFAGQVQLGAGTAAAPALSAFGDTNTGMFFPAADTLAFVEGGAEAMRIDSSANLLVGTTTAVSKLTVNGDVAGTFFVNPTTVSANYTIPTNYNAMTAGVISINSGVTVTVPSGSTWTVV